MIRLLDIFLSVLGLILFSPLIILTTILVFVVDNVSPIFKQERLGRHEKIFILLKIRTMLENTPSVASHLADASCVTRVGRFLRKTKLDELPQLWNVLRGDMSFVGPRPGLADQRELRIARRLNNCFSVRPGVTGLGQINNIDMSNPKLLAMVDAHMIRNFSVFAYCKYLGLTVIGRGHGDAINWEKYRPR